MERYEVLKDIGDGNVSVTRLMRNKETEEVVAVKYIPWGFKHERYNIFFSSSQTVADGAHFAEFSTKLPNFEGLQLKNTTLFVGVETRVIISAAREMYFLFVGHFLHLLWTVTFDTAISVQAIKINFNMSGL
ncbi:hypothetical protein CFC21_006273 [Triticum aestivum]|uniref:Uncharacterized protein n=3 Tax=Triticum TaxID=4564 RepID=A0A9R0QRF6_TRITD|nr:hypothetical protein CFC21_006273 [Triticum aestivum]VAH15940.1 unnamed protein product [Triticum turgidum subsp. durum]